MPVSPLQTLTPSLPEGEGEEEIPQRMGGTGFQPVDLTTVP